MSNNIVEDVLLLPTIAAGVVAAAATTAIGGVVSAGEGLTTLGHDFGSGVTDVLNQMQTENQERLKLEQEWIMQIREERDKAFNQINAYIASLVKLSESDLKFSQLVSVSGVAEQAQSIVNKREARATQIRQLRDKAIRSRDIEEIAACADAAEILFNGLSAELQTEIIFFAQNGLDLPEYGSMHDDAIKMALANKNEISEVKLKFLEDGQAVTEAMIRYDMIVFEDCLSEFLCEEGLNDRQLRDLLAIKQDLKKIDQDSTITLDIKKKRLATLFTTYARRQQGIKAELTEMSEYYDTYLRETFDIPDERLELADFDSIDEIVAETKEAKINREERLKKQYVQIQMDRIMKKHGLNVVESAVMGRSEDDKRVLYGIDDSAAVDVFISEKGMVSTRVVGVNFGGTPTDAEEEALVQKEHKFCSKMAAIEADLEDVGIVLRRKKTVPPGREYNTWVQIDKATPVQRNKVVRRKRRQNNDKVRYME